MMTPIFDSNTAKILILYSISPGSRFNRTYLKEKTRLNNIPLDKALISLLHSGILKRDGNLYAMDFECEYTKAVIDIFQKIYRSLKELPLEVFYPLMDLVSYFAQQKSLEVYLFGSYAKLVYSVRSDIDIAVVSVSQPKKSEIIKIVSRLEKTYGKPIEIHYFDKKTFYSNKSDPLIKSILKDGVKLV